MYQVGILPHIKPDDPIFDKYTDAAERAIEWSDEDGSPVSIWRDPKGDAELIGIAYQGEVFVA